MNGISKIIIKTLSAFALCMVMIESSHAVIININSLTNNESNPVSVYFDAGTYDVTPIGISDGGAYNAWNAWYAWYPNPVGCDQDGTNCTYGWLNYYHIASAEFGELFLSDGIIRHATPLLALESAVGTSFTLTTGAYVDFFIRDGVDGDLASDNAGGMSLKIEDPFNVPEPQTVSLMVLGLLALSGIARSRIRRVASHI